MKRIFLLAGAALLAATAAADQAAKTPETPKTAETARTADAAKPAGREPPCDEAGVLQSSDSDREIPPFLHDIDIPVGKTEIERHGGVEPAEFSESRNNLPEAEGEGNIEPQRSPRLDAVEAGGGLRFLDLGEDALAGGEIVPALFGKNQLAGGSMQQLDAEVILQLAHAMAERRLR